MQWSNLFSALREAFAPPLEPHVEEHPDAEHQIALVPNGYTLEHLSGPTAQRPKHNFHDLRDFSAYLHRRAKPEPTDIIIDAKHATAVLGFDDKTAAQLTCTLVKHPSWLAWARILRKSLSVKDLHDHLRAVPETLPPLNGKDGKLQPITQGQHLLAQLRKLNVVETTDLKIEISRHGTTQFAGGSQKATVNGELPAELHLQVPLYDEVYPTDDGPNEVITYDLEVLIDIQIKDGDVTFLLTAPRIDQVRRKALRDATAWLRHLVGSEWMVCVGDVALDNVMLPV